MHLHEAGSAAGKQATTTRRRTDFSSLPCSALLRSAQVSFHQPAAEMSKIEMLRLLINQRLTAAAEEIFGVFGRTIAEYEEEISRSKLEIDRQRRLLDLSRKPQVSLQATGTGR